MKALLLLLLAALANAQELCDADQSRILADRARSALKSGDPSMAAGLFRQGYEACPTERRLLLNAVQALTAARKFNAAIETANLFLREQPESLDGRLALANALLMAQKWD